MTMISQEITHKIIGAAMEVHSQLGNGFQEVIYQRSLSHEMQLREIPFEREKEMNIRYKNWKVGTRRVDFLVNGKIMVELKSVIKLDDVHLAQAINYLESYQVPIGLLINFGSKSLEFKRLFNNKLR